MHGLWYDKEKGVASSDKLGEHESNEEKAEGVIKGPRQVYNLLRNNLERIDVLMAQDGLLAKMGVKQENIVVPREFFILGPKDWAVSAWPYYFESIMRSSEGKYMPDTCKKNNWKYCICLCKDQKDTYGTFELNSLRDCNEESYCESIPKRLFTKPDSSFNAIDIVKPPVSFKIFDEKGKMILQKKTN